MPPINGLCLPGRILVSINSVEFLDDIYMKSNAFNTKHPESQKMFSMVANQNIVFMDTFHKDYNAARKELSSAFFKHKLKSFISIIKQEVVEVIKDYQTRQVTEVDIVDFWREVQSKIFTAVAVGRGNTKMLCDYELEDGSIIKRTLGDLIARVLEDTVNRVRHILLQLFPDLLPYALTSNCRRYARNVRSIRNAFQQIINDRR